MKIRIIAIALLLPLLTGCYLLQPQTTQPDTGQDDSAVEIAELKRDLANLRLSQLLQAEAYESEIRRLQEEIDRYKNGESEEPVTTPPTEDPTLQERYQIKKVSNGIEIVAYLGDERNVTVPSEFNGEPVVSIGEGAFRNASLESVVLPYGVKKIGWFAFYGCYRLRSVTLYETVTAIDYGAFDLCDKGLTFHCPQASYAEAYAISYGYLSKVIVQ